MKTKATLLYLLHEKKKAISIYYIVILCFFLLTSITTVIVSILPVTMEGSMVSELCTITAVFLFVVGLNSFKENFGMLTQNSVSRKTIFKSSVVAFVCISALMAVIDSAINIVLMLVDSIVAKNSTLRLSRLFVNMSFAEFSANMNIAQKLGIEFLFAICMSVFAMSLGFVITLIYYRLQKKGKWAISVSVPLGLYILIQADFVFLKGFLSFKALEILSLIFMGNGNPFIAMIFMALLSVLINAASYLLIKKAVIK